MDIILIQHTKKEIDLLEYCQEHTKMKVEHSDIFSGFPTAIQKITQELDIGNVVLIATEGSKGHNCIIIPKEPISDILLVDQNDQIEFWQKQGHKIANEFIKQYGTKFDPTYILKFEQFIPTLKEMCMTHNYCD